MSSRRVNFTCSDIDEAQIIAQSIAKDLNNWVSQLKTIRSSNIELRKWAEKEEERADNLEAELEKRQHELEKAQEEILSLKEIIKGYEP